MSTRTAGEGLTGADSASALCDSHLEGFESLKADLLRHMVSSQGLDTRRPAPEHVLRSLILAVRDRLIDRWIHTQRSFYEQDVKRVYYLSLEYLPGKLLMNCLHSLGLVEEARTALGEVGFQLEDLAEMEWDMGLGNGGLGRLASCFLDSMACLRLPAFGYGIRYDYGIFYQTLQDGWQVERCDNWMRNGNPWEFERYHHIYEVKFYGRVREYTDALGRVFYEWADTESIRALACDTLIPGYQNGYALNMRLWAARSSREFDLEFFNHGDYIRAVEDRIRSENISKVLYPSEEAEQGKELRLKQQYFMVSATLQDILRRYVKRHDEYDSLPDRVAIQLNDTHPTVAIPELMRVLVDEHRMEWDRAWDITTRVFGYTNHTILPEALETWPVSLFGRVLPRHLQIIYEINQRFLDQVRGLVRGNEELIRKLSLVGEEGEKHVRMANLAVVGSHSVNGVAALHTHLLKTRVLRDFHEIYPHRFNNKTNGITPRRFLLQCNPGLSELIAEHLGWNWVMRLERLKHLAPQAENREFRARWQAVRLANKKRLGEYILRKVGVEVNPNSLFDVQVKRIHEYKRQLLNVLHAVTLYNRIKLDHAMDTTPRTIIFSGKAAPSYAMAKLVIRLIGGVSSVVNNDEEVKDRLKVIFLPNYCVSQSERLVPASDLSEQISTAGMEASGTGNMKFALNGSLIIGTLDGANVEIAEEVGQENMFIFGHTVEELEHLRARGYNPWHWYESDDELKRAVDLVASGFFSQGDVGLFKPIVDALLTYGDRYFILADFRKYLDCQKRVEELWADPEEWTRRSILNTAHMGKFSSDRAIAEYARDIWGVSPLR